MFVKFVIAMVHFTSKGNFLKRMVLDIVVDKSLIRTFF